MHANGMTNGYCDRFKTFACIDSSFKIKISLIVPSHVFCIPSDVSTMRLVDTKDFFSYFHNFFSSSFIGRNS